jgi:hypothetical protein
MLTDPVTVVYSGSSKSLARAAGTIPGVVKVMGRSVYKTADGEYSLHVENARRADGSSRAEILLGRTMLDPDSPFVGNYNLWSNRVGLIFESNDLKVNTNTDIGLLRASLLTLVDSTLQGRLIGGEF